MIEVLFSVVLFGIITTSLDAFRISSLHAMKNRYHYAIANHHAVMLADCLNQLALPRQLNCIKAAREQLSQDIPNGRLRMQHQENGCKKITILWRDQRAEKCVTYSTC